MTTRPLPFKERLSQSIDQVLHAHTPPPGRALLKELLLLKIMPVVKDEIELFADAACLRLNEKQPGRFSRAQACTTVKTLSANFRIDAKD